MFRVLIRILVVLINIFYFKLVIIMTKLVVVHIYPCLISCYYFKIIGIISELFLSHSLSSIQPNRKIAHHIHPTKHASWISLSLYPWIIILHPTLSSNQTHPKWSSPGSHRERHRAVLRLNTPYVHEKVKS